MMSSTLKYTTLSHCRGGSVPTRLLNTNHATFVEKIVVADLPRMFRDAVAATRTLGLEYLWIDSLCIIQDSVDDWDKESNKMYTVYRNSHLNLAAVTSADATGGLFCPDTPLSKVPCFVKIGTPSNAEWAKTRYTSGIEESRDVPLLEKAWVFQETILPTRILFFTKNELCWECHETHRTETYPESERWLGIDGTYQNDEDIVAFRKNWQDIWSKDSSSRFEIWKEVVYKYSQKGLTMSSDKLVAVARLTADLTSNWSSVDYLAGLWSYNLLDRLLWRSNFRSRRSRFYIAPSWSVMGLCARPGFDV
jgi:hypothetical protein